MSSSSLTNAANLTLSNTLTSYTNSNFTTLSGDIINAQTMAVDTIAANNLKIGNLAFNLTNPSITIGNANSIINVLGTTNINDINTNIKDSLITLNKNNTNVVTDSGFKIEQNSGVKASVLLDSNGGFIIDSSNDILNVGAIRSTGISNMNSTVAVTGTTTAMNGVNLYSNPNSTILGLKFVICAGDISSLSNANYFQTNTIVDSGYTSDFTTTSTATNGKRVSGTLLTNYSIEWTGYFKPNISGSWQFTLRSDDGSWFWIGSTALSGYTTSNADIKNGGSHAAASVSSSLISLTANTYYYIRIQYGQGAGQDEFSFSATPPSGTAITNLSGLCFNSLSDLIKFGAAGSVSDWATLNPNYINLKPALSLNFNDDINDGEFYIRNVNSSVPTDVINTQFCISGGYVGINKSNPQATLDVSGTTTLMGNTTLNSNLILNNNLTVSNPVTTGAQMSFANSLAFLTGSDISLNNILTFDPSCTRYSTSVTITTQGTNHYYLNMGALKLAWGTIDTITTSSSASSPYLVDVYFPTNFFNTATNVIAFVNGKTGNGARITIFGGTGGIVLVNGSRFKLPIQINSDKLNDIYLLNYYAIERLP
jgi:hypothetical protein